MNSAIRKKYLAILGREPLLSLAELEALFGEVRQIGTNLAEFEMDFSGGFCRRRFPQNFAMQRFWGSPFDDVTRQKSQNFRPNLIGQIGGSIDRNRQEPEFGLIDRLGGTLKLAEKLAEKPLEFLNNCPEGKITLGVSDYSRRASRKSASMEALKLKKILVRHGRSVRVVENKEAMLSTATSLHNGLSGKNPRKVELIKVENDWYRVVGVQDIDAYAKRDQARPARDAKVGMLPPKLAQILINLCGTLPENARILDPFCGTGVVLQEALLMGYSVYGTDLEPRMAEYTRRNLEWFLEEVQHCGLGTSATNGERPERLSPVTTGAKERVLNHSAEPPQVSNPMSRRYAPSLLVTAGDATTYQWQPPIGAVVCESYLGRPMSQIPPEIKLKAEKMSCEAILRGFFKNLAPQIAKNTPVVVAAPAWLRENGEYSRLNLIDFLDEMGYNVDKKTREGLFYHRDGQIVARDIMILRKK